jgi:DNA-binding transcriptional ArsR family regulator
MADRWEVERAIIRSGLPSQARLVALVLLTRTDAATAAIPAQFSPSLAALAADTGLDKSTIKRHLNVLEAGGWVTRIRDPRAQSSHIPTGYALHASARRTESLGAESAKPPRGTERQGLGAENHEARRTVRPNQTGQPKPDQKQPAPANADPYASLPGFAAFWAAYPRRTAKRAAASAYRRALNRCGDAELLVKAAAAYRDDPGRAPEFTRHPATWLNGDCWEDDPLPRRNGRPGDIDWNAAVQRARARDASRLGLEGK